MAPVQTPKTVFVTGGTGFIGAHAVRALLAHGWHVRALVRRGRAGLLPIAAEPVPGDLTDSRAYGQWLRGCNAILHCAGATRARTLEQYRRINVAGTEALVRAAAGACPDAMFVHVSSQAAAGPSRDGVPVRERDAPAPISWYGRSKLESERIVASDHDGPWCVVRPSVVYGAGDPGLLPMFSVVARGVAPIPSGGRQRVQLLAADDLARILVAVTERPDLHRRCVFVAGDTVSVGDVVREIAGLRTPPARTIPVPRAALRLLGLVESVRGTLTRTTRPLNRDKIREMLQPDWLCDAEPFLRELGTTVAVGWREGLRRTCRWYVGARWLASRHFASV